MAADPNGLRRRCPVAAAALVLALGGCGAGEPPIAPDSGPACDADNGGLRLPPGFCALVVADHLGGARHLVVREDGDLFVTLRLPRLDAGGIAALRDGDGDGRADRVEHFGDEGGVGIGLRGDTLYFGADERIVRYRMAPGRLLPDAAPEPVVSGFPGGTYHGARTFAIGPRGELYVSVGAPSNACQVRDRAPGSPGRDPCPELESSAGLWRYDAGAGGQVHGVDGRPYARGIRHALALDLEPSSAQPYVVQHGRDDLHANWPHLYSAAQDERLPAEEMIAVDDGARYAWPYCYYDGEAERFVLAPEYGGDGERADRCAQFPAPVLALPAHAGPNDMLFYRGDAFPARYHGGAFIALHGRYRDAGGEWDGYQVAFVPFAGGRVAGPWEVFAHGFAGDRGRIERAEPLHRPTGLAMGPDGSLYVLDSQSGRVWRIRYRGPAGGGP